MDRRTASHRPREGDWGSPAASRRPKAHRGAQSGSVEQRIGRMDLDSHRGQSSRPGDVDRRGALAGSAVEPKHRKVRQLGPHRQLGHHLWGEGLGKCGEGRLEACAVCRDVDRQRDITAGHCVEALELAMLPLAVVVAGEDGGQVEALGTVELVWSRRTEREPVEADLVVAQARWRRCRE